MRKKNMFIVIAIVSILSTSCFGGFQTTRKVYQWNEGVSGNKFVNNLVFYGLNIIPVYPVAGTLDLFIFNLIEFWTGSNPMALNEGEFEH
jgi:hypothetical protein